MMVTIPPPISTKQTITSHLKSLNIKNIMTYGAGNPHNGLGKVQKCCKVFLTDKVLPKLFFSFYWNSIDIFSGLNWSFVPCTINYRGRRGRDHMVTGFTTTFAIRTYHH